MVSCNDDLLPTDEFGSGPKIVGFASKFQQVAYFTDEGTVNVDIPVNLIGEGNGQLLQAPLEIPFEVVTTGDNATTATEGVEYNFIGEKKVIIPANSTVGIFPIKVNTGTLNPTMKTTLTIKLLTPTTPGVVVGRQNETYKIIFVGCQSQLAGTYSVTVTRSDGIVRTYAPEIIFEVGTNYFKTTTTGTWAAPDGLPAPDQGFNFTDICGEITVAPQGLAQGYYSNNVQGLASDGVDGVVTGPDSFKITYEISFAAGNRTYTNVYTRLP